MNNMARFIQGNGSIKSDQGLLKSANNLSLFGIQLKKTGLPILEECKDKFLVEQLGAVLGQLEPIQVSFDLMLS